MKTRRFSLTAVVHAWIQSQSWPSGILLDMTTGAGHDLLLLATSLPDHPLMAIDVQPLAIERSQQRISEALGEPSTHRIHWRLGCHSRVLEWIDELSPSPDGIALAIYNLGYLPGSDKSTITQKNSTIESLHQLQSRIVAGGAISLMLYTGHAGGLEEAEAVIAWATALDRSQWHVWHMQRQSHPVSPENSPAPSWLLLQRV